MRVIKVEEKTISQQTKPFYEVTVQFQTDELTSGLEITSKVNFVDELNKQVSDVLESKDNVKPEVMHFKPTEVYYVEGMGTVRLCDVIAAGLNDKTLTVSYRVGTQARTMSADFEFATEAQKQLKILSHLIDWWNKNNRQNR